MDTLLARLGLALAIGLLIGLERGWREREAPDRSRTAGIRTYGISGLLGGVLAALAQSLDAVSVLITGFLGFAAVLAFYKAREAAHDEDFSVTGVMAGLAVFALGALAVAGDYTAAAGAAAALAALLASREVLHGLLKRLTWIELRSALILAVMTAMVLPLLPNRTVDPWGGLNPREIWLFTVLTAAISYLGYIAVRMLGETRGLAISAVCGALISSTAVTLALGRMARTAERNHRLAGAAALAATVSLARIAFIIGLVEPRVLIEILPATLAVAAVFGLCSGLMLARGVDAGSVDTSSRSPFDLGPLLLFALLFAAVSTLNAALAGHIGPAGLIVATAASGAVDVDVAVLSVLRLVGTSMTVEAAGRAVLAAIAANALLRLILAMATSTPRFWAPLLFATTGAGALGGVVFVFSPSVLP
ncbi:MgtC/SapB family protein [Mesorhizobium sp. ASY16-5R]|uniref:MgtC/SapB family protein n=1 Tax=Mesorhizobium sp. ASY16-5R TaxID=3445772 RepID=UPI003FA0E00B